MLKAESELEQRIRAEHVSNEEDLTKMRTKRTLNSRKTEFRNFEIHRIYYRQHGERKTAHVTKILECNASVFFIKHEYTFA